jgi:hypothetical protein
MVTLDPPVLVDQQAMTRVTYLDYHEEPRELTTVSLETSMPIDY